MTPRSRLQVFQYILLGMLVFFGLLAVGRSNFLLFHGLAELFSIALAWSVFFLVWNTKKIIRNDFLLFLGIAYFFVGLIDLFHTLSYHGMGVFPDNTSANIATQLWISARGLETISLLMFPLFITRRLRFLPVLGLFASATALLLSAIFSWNVFPACFIEGQGQTPFKKGAEYLIILILSATITWLFRIRKQLDRKVFLLMIGAMTVTAIGEFILTLYVSVYDVSLIAGHFLKIISFFLVYLALVHSSLTQPYTTLFKEIEKEKEALREKEKEQQLLLENLQVGIVVHAPDTRILYTNRDACKILGLSPDQILGKEAIDPYWRFLHEDGTAVPLEAYPVNIVAGSHEKLKNYVLGIVVPGRESETWVLVNAYPVFTSGNTLRQIVVSFIDISKHKLAETALRESKAFLDNLNDIAYTADSQGKLLWANRAAQSITGQSLEMIIGKPFLPLFVEKDHLSLMDVYRRTLLGESLENTLTFTSGKTCHFTSLPRRNRAGEIIGTFGIARDITEKQQSEKALKQSEDRLSRAQQVAKIGNWEYDISTGKVWGSEEAFRIYGIERKSEYLPLQEVEDCIIEAQRVNKSLVDLITRNKPYDIEFEIKPRNREGITVIHSIAELVPDSSGKPAIVTGVIQDITESKTQEKERAHLIAQLQQAQKMESVGRLAGGVAHDFNNMLGVILGHVEMALEDLAEDSPLRTDLEEILTATNRSADLTRQLLAFARKQTITPKILDINDTIEGILKLLRRLIGEDIQLIWLPGKNIGQVNMDPSQVDQILTNLCVNAKDAITGTGKITIETEFKSLDDLFCQKNPEFSKGDYILVRIRDTGCGMDMQTQEQLFEPFFTTKELGKGTGLGLATVYGIIKQNNGFIRVDSAPGQGSLFTIYLPRFTEPSVSITSEAEHSVLRNRPETVLLTEDAPSLLKMTEKMLKQMGFRVLTASTPKEAITLAERNSSRLNLLLTDIIMPEMNGKALSKKISALVPGIKTVYMSGYSADVIAAHEALDPDFHFIHKPFSMRTLSKKMSEVLDIP